MKRRSRQLEHPTAHVDDLSDSRIWLRLVGSAAARRLPIFVDIARKEPGNNTARPCLGQFSKPVVRNPRIVFLGASAFRFAVRPRK